MSLLSPSLGEWPKLIQSEDDNVCSGYLRALQSSFLSDSFHVDARDGLSAWGVKSLFSVNPYSSDGPEGARPILFMPDAEIRGPNFAAIQLARPYEEGGGYLLIRWREHSWRGFTYAVSVVPESLSDELLNALDSGNETLDAVFEKGEVVKSVAGHWTAPLIAEDSEARIFFRARFSASFPPSGALYEIKPSQIKLVCRAEIYPPTPSFRFDRARVRNREWFREGAPDYDFSKWRDTSYSDLFKAVRLSQGNECAGGTLNSLTRRQLGSAVARMNFRVRPWALNLPYDTRGDISKLLKVWSYRDPWSRKIYLTIVNSFKRARTELSIQLKKDFGVDTSEQERLRLADELLWRTVGSHYIFGSTGAYSLGSGDALIKQIYEDEINSDDLEGIYHQASPEERHDILFATLRRPDQLKQLLEAGVDANAKNQYGKTALMYAAHLNYGESASLLLEHGADINTQTYASKRKGYFNCENPNVTGRTALTYAAENASLELIKLLLTNGADPSITPRRDRMEDLIGLNPMLSKHEQRSIRDLLQ